MGLVHHSGLWTEVQWGGRENGVPAPFFGVGTRSLTFLH